MILPGRPQAAHEFVNQVRQMHADGGWPTAKYMDNYLEYLADGPGGLTAESAEHTEKRIEQKKDSGSRGEPDEATTRPTTGRGD